MNLNNVYYAVQVLAVGEANAPELTHAVFIIRGKTIIVCLSNEF